MDVKVKSLGVWWMITLLSAAGLSAANSDLRLVNAVRQGDKEAVRLLLKQHADVNAAQPDGATPLAWAAYRDDLETADLLIRSGANAKAANIYGVTPLSLACVNGNPAMVDRLLKAGADSNAAQQTGETPLMYCARSGNVEAVTSLLAHQANVNAKETREGQTALMWAVAAKHPEVARTLVEHGAEINAHAKSGFTPLMFAAQQGDLDAARTLLAAGAKVNEATNAEGVWEGDTALLVASASGYEELSIFLLDKGADPNAADENGFTALHYAMIKGLALICRVRIQREKEWLLAPYLIRPNMVELVKSLLAHGANPNARVKPGANGDKLLRVTGIDGGPVSSPVGATPYLLAAVTDDISLMRILAAGGADTRLATEENITPLIVAAGLIRQDNNNGASPEEQERGSLDAVRVAMELGADVNAANNHGLTALHVAAMHGSNKIVQLLAEKGANLDARDTAGQTPLHKAANIKPAGVVAADLLPNRAYKSTADLLLKLGATPVSASETRGSDAAAATATK